MLAGGGEQPVVADLVPPPVGGDQDRGGAGIDVGRPGRHRQRLAGGRAAALSSRGLELPGDLLRFEGEEVVLIEREAQQLLQLGLGDPDLDGASAAEPPPDAHRAVGAHGEIGAGVFAREAALADRHWMTIACGIVR